MSKPALLLTIKNPVKGKVKTRLAATAGEERALEIYRALLRHTREEAEKVEAVRYVFYSDFKDENDDWDDRLFIKKVQCSGDIGDRMADCFNQSFPIHTKAVLAGSDIPGLTADILNTAFEMLSDFDFVIGPATDGGYYLIGMKTFEPAVFKDIEWSTASVFDQTIQKIEAAGKTWFRLPELSDVDFEEDWEQHGWKL